MSQVLLATFLFHLKRIHIYSDINNTLHKSPSLIYNPLARTTDNKRENQDSPAVPKVSPDFLFPPDFLIRTTSPSQIKQLLKLVNKSGRTGPKEGHSDLFRAQDLTIKWN